MAQQDFTAIVAPYLNNIFVVIFNPLIMLLFFIALGYFAFGIIKMLANPGNEDARKQGKGHILWGIVGMTIMLSVYGIISLIGGTIKDVIG